MNRFGKILKQIAYGLLAIVFWIFVWHFLAQKIDNVIFLPTPKQTFKALFDICGRKEFKIIVWSSFFRIFKGFILAIIIGVAIAIIAYFIKLIDILISPLMKLIKAVPVASFIILALLWINSKDLATLISFMMVLPIVYINLLQALKNVDENMLEIVKVFNVNLYRRIRFIYMPNILPALIAACKIGLGFSFKAGIAAEIIGLPMNSIGWELYQSKLYLMTEEMFAWTVVIIFISIFIEGICIYLLNRFSEKILKFNNFKPSKRDNTILRSETDNAAKKEIELNNISKSYGKEQVLKNVNITFNSYEPVCIMGESGVGKTTLTRIILGLTKPDSGSLKNLSKLKTTVVFQEDRLIENVDIYTNLYCALGNKFTKISVDKHLKELGLEGEGNKIVKELSGGMKRRVAVIRAILTDSDIIILDEAFKGLDEKNKDITIEYVKKYCKNKILILVTHDISECEKFGGKIEVLDGGSKKCGHE